MKLVKARIQNYRSIKDTGEFTLENLKTILVGPNEAGKTVVLKALQQLNKPEDIDGFDEIRDYPRSLYNDITIGKVDPAKVEIVRGWFSIDEEDKIEIPVEFHNCTYVVSKNLNNQIYHHLENAPAHTYFKDIKDNLLRLARHLDQQNDTEGAEQANSKVNEFIQDISPSTVISDSNTPQLVKWFKGVFADVDEHNEKELSRYKTIETLINNSKVRTDVLTKLSGRMPVFVLFNNYFKVKPIIHLEHLANRVEGNIMDDDKFYDYGNLCLLKLLGFSPRELSTIGKTASPNSSDTAGLKNYRDILDKRFYQLDAASVRLTREIRTIWNPNPKRPEAEKLEIIADGQYLKVVVEDELGVKIELDQRSEGFQWLVSFYVVFFAEAEDKHKNAILLLDEPGMSLHALKQREFRMTLSRLAENNQTIYTTHSPFLVGPDELDLVRIIELKSREEGTKVHTTISSSDPAGLLPLQEALGYDLAQSLFTQQKNLVLEGLTDYWYLDATANLFREAGLEKLDEKIALVFANSAGKVVYYATILHAHNLKIAALLDSDNAGDQAANQENLVHSLGNKKILRTKDYCDNVPKAEIEDLLRDTLVKIVKTEFGNDVSSAVKANPNKPIIDIFTKEIKDFSKYKLAKAFVNWTRANKANALSETERNQWTELFQSINKALK